MVGIIVTYFLQNQRNFNDVFIIGSLVVLSFWIIEAIVIIFNPTIVVTETEIKKCFWKKIKWSVPRENIQECIYTRMRWFMFIDPISTINVFQLHLKLKDKKNSRKVCSLSLKEVKKIQQTFNYQIKIIDTIYEDK